MSTEMTPFIYLEVSEDESDLIKALITAALLEESTMPYETTYSKELETLLARLERQGC